MKVFAVVEDSWDGIRFIRLYKTEKAAKVAMKRMNKEESLCGAYEVRAMEVFENGN